MFGVNRREFLAASALAGATAFFPGRSEAATWKTKIHKALIGTPDEATLEAWKAAGFEGYESTDRSASPEKAEAARKLAEKHGMRIHSVMFGWANFNQPKKVEPDLAAVETALRAARPMAPIPCSWCLVAWTEICRSLGSSISASRKRRAT